MSNAKTILVADDESHILNVVSLKLTNAGFTVFTAVDGQEALELATAQRPDLLITDYHMPQLSGLELCQRLMQNPATAGIPTIMLTARGYSLEPSDTEQNGINRMLSKPFSPRQLLATVNEMLLWLLPPERTLRPYASTWVISMSISHFASSATAAPAVGVVPTSMLENLAARYRPGGLCLILFRPDGTVVWHDPSALPFFQKFVVALASSPDKGKPPLGEKFASVTGTSPVMVWDTLPGIAMAGFPYVERRQLSGILVLAAKSTCFRLNDDVVRICNHFGVDGIWLNQQADELPAYPEEAIQRQARLLLGSVRDQIRLSGLEHELTSISGQLTNTYEELSLIYQISGGMRISRRPADFFRQACLDSIEVMGVSAMGVALKATDTIGSDPVMFGPKSLSPNQGERLTSELIAWMTRRKSSLLINDLRSDKQFNWLSDDATRLLAVPLQRGEQILGCLYAMDKNHGDFDSVDSKLLNSIANESAIYLENAVLFEDVHGLMMGLLHSLTSAVDAKDAYTCGHSERVAVLGKLLAKEYGLDDAQVERIYMAGLLHDVGKIGVPEAVLKKPGRLTVEEFEQMKRHPAIGAKILQDVKQIQDIIPGVLHHHERFDGRGYPDGLSGHNIPIMGRIICLADCFDAMTSTRTYRKAMPLEVTLADIRRCSGTQFDPALTEAFLHIPTDKLRDILRQQDTGGQNEIPCAAPIPSAVPSLLPGKAA